MPFEKDDKGERTFGVGSVVKGFALGAPIGIGVRKWWQETDFNAVIKAAKQPTINSPYSRAYNATRQANFEFTTEIAGRIGQWNFVELNNTINRLRANPSGLSAHNIKDALLRAAESSDPTGSIRTRLTKKLDLAQDPISVLEDINTISRTSTESIYMQRTVSSFLDNLNVLQQRKDIGKPLRGLTTPDDTRLWSIRNISGAEVSPRFEKSIKDISGKLGGYVEVGRAIRTGKSPLEGELRLSFFESPLLGEQIYTEKGRPIPQLTLKLPSSLPEDPNMVIHGATGQSRYIAGQFWDIERLPGGKYGVKNSFKYEEWAANRFLEQTLPEMMKQQRMTRSAINSFRDDYHKSILKPLQWVEDVPTGAFPAVEKYKSIRGQIAHLYGEGGRELTDIEYANVLRQGIQGQKIYPGASPGSIAKNVVSLRDWRDVEPFAGAFDWGKRPLQRIRAEHFPTQSALELIEKDLLSKRFSWLGQKYAPPSPMMRFAYAKGSQAAELAKYGMNIEGSGLVSRSKLPLLAQQELTRYTVRADQIYDLADYIPGFEAGQTEWTGVGKMAPGRFLGYGLEGEPLITEDPLSILQIKRHIDKQKGDYFKIVATKELSDFNQFKAFGGVKGMMSFMDQREMNRMTTNLFGFDSMYDPGITAVASIDELKKNRALHNKQMISALFDFTRQNMESGKQMGRHAGDFLNKPAKYIAGINKAARKNSAGIYDNDVVVRKMMRIAREGRLTPQQMGGAFGAVPEVYGMKAGTPEALKEEFMSRFKLWVSKEEAGAILSGTPIGVSQLSFGGLYGPGSGKTGTVEPRMFELLSSPQFGKLGPEIQEEIATRMMTSYPQRMDEQAVLRKSLMSVLSPGKGGVLPSETTNFLKESMDLNIPGIGSIFVPTSSELSQLSSYTTPGKQEVASELAQKYKQIYSQALELEQEKITPTEMRAGLNELASLLHRERVGTITGASSLTRGRLPGSEFLTAMPRANIGNVQIGKGEVGITEKYFSKMARDMERIYGKKEMNEIRRRFLSGGTVGGMVARHPFIGPYSTGMVGLKMIPGEDARAVLGEEFLDTSYRTAAGEAISLGQLRYGSALGMAADYDADIVNVMLASPNIEGKVLAQSREFDKYEAYSIRTQLMKAQKAKDVPTLSEAVRMSGASLKLRIPQERLGLISETLQEARAAVLMNQVGLEEQRSMNALGLLEWLEQTPISAKHIVAGKEVETISLLEDIRTSISKRKAGNLASSVRSIVGRGNVAEKMLEEGLDVSIREGAGVRTLNVPSIGLEQASRDIMTSMDLFHIPGKEGLSPARLRQLLRNRGSAATAKEMAILSNHPFTGMSAFSGFLTHSAAPGRLSEMVSYARGLRNTVAAAGGKLLEHATPIGLGFAAAVGIATVFSSPPKSLRPGDLDVPTPSTAGGSGGANMGVDVEPQEIMRGRPTMRTMEMFGRRGVVSTGSIGGTSMNIEVSSPGATDYNQLSSQISSSIRNTSVSSRVIDNRRSLTPQKISSIMEEG